MASLKNIEILTQELQKHDIPTEPPWILAIDSAVSDAGHISGQLREASDIVWDNDRLTAEELNHQLSILLGEAAEQLDDAHEEWLFDKLRATQCLRNE
jgi:hypothetical protein